MMAGYCSLTDLPDMVNTSGIPANGPIVMTCGPSVCRKNPRMVVYDV
jgi:hypothetical protein